VSWGVRSRGTQLASVSTATYRTAFWAIEPPPRWRITPAADPARPTAAHGFTSPDEQAELAIINGVVLPAAQASDRRLEAMARGEPPPGSATARWTECAGVRAFEWRSVGPDGLHWRHVWLRVERMILLVTAAHTATGDADAIDRALETLAVDRAAVVLAPSPPSSTWFRLGHATGWAVGKLWHHRLLVVLLLFVLAVAVLYGRGAI
jgi:hypothetical protein